MDSPLLLRVFSDRPLRGFFLPLGVDLRDERRRAFPRTTKATRGVEDANACRLPSGHDLVRVRVSLFARLLRDLCPSKRFATWVGRGTVVLDVALMMHGSESLYSRARGFFMRLPHSGPRGEVGAGHPVREPTVQFHC